MKPVIEKERAPREAIERTNAPSSRVSSCIRIRSPSNAPPVNGLDGSTASTPTVRPRARHASAYLSVSVLFPAPGGPVKPIRNASPTPAWMAWRISSKPGPWFSIQVSPRARARRSPAAKRSRRSARRESRDVKVVKRSPCLPFRPPGSAKPSTI